MQSDLKYFISIIGILKLMKILSSGPVTEFSALSPQHSQQAQNDSFWSRRKTLICKVDNEYVAVSVTLLDRILACALGIFGVNYYSGSFAGKQVKVLSNAEIKDEEQKANLCATQSIIPHREPAANCTPNAPLSRTGGIVNGGNTCYIASCLQCIKNLSRFETYLDANRHPLTKKLQETDQSFALRQALRQQLKNLLNKMNEGATISASEINSFRATLTRHNPPTISYPVHPSEGGEVIEVWEVIADALEIPKISINNQRWFLFQYAYMFLASTDSLDVGAEIAKLEFSCAPDILPLHFDRRTQNLIEFPIELQLNCQGTSARYRLKDYLTGITVQNRNRTHTWAFLKDRTANNFVVFNDSQVTANAAVDESVKRNLKTLFYERMDATS